MPGPPSQGQRCPRATERWPRAGAAAVVTARCDCVFKILQVSPVRVLTNVSTSANRHEVRRRAFHHAPSSPLWPLTDPPPPSRPEPGANATPESFANDSFSPSRTSNRRTRTGSFASGPLRGAHACGIRPPRRPSLWPIPSSRGGRSHHMN